MTFDELKIEAEKIYGDKVFIIHNATKELCAIGMCDLEDFYLYGGGKYELALQNALTRKLCALPYESKASYNEIIEGLRYKKYDLYLYYPDEGIKLYTNERLNRRVKYEDMP